MAQNNYKTVHEKYRILQKWPKVKTSSVIDLDQIVGHDRRSFIVIVKTHQAGAKTDEAHQRGALTRVGDVSGLKTHQPRSKLRSRFGDTRSDDLIIQHPSHSHVHQVHLLSSRLLILEFSFFFSATLNFTLQEHQT